MRYIKLAIPYIESKIIAFGILLCLMLSTINLLYIIKSKETEVTLEQYIYNNPEKTEMFLTKQGDLIVGTVKQRNKDYFVVDDYKGKRYSLKYKEIMQFKY